MPRYRFRLPDGQTYESTNTPAQIRKAHPGAVITHRIDFDGVGNPLLIPFAGKMDAEDAAVSVEGAETGNTTLKRSKAG